MQKSLTPAVDAIDYCVQLLSKKPESHIAMLENLKKKTGACGYLWMEAEICAMLAELGKDVTINKNRSTRIHKECGTTTAACFFCYSCRYQTLKIINQKSQDNDNNKSLTPRITVNCYGN
ncbi:MAG: hypothetical protein U9N77_03575 [Thermodesulfobacteriota bacterium]|nr:hypothetical protein [Thermodesulfobacteriota bacterium]